MHYLLHLALFLLELFGPAAVVLIRAGGGTHFIRVFAGDGGHRKLWGGDTALLFALFVLFEEHLYDFRLDELLRAGCLGCRPREEGRQEGRSRRLVRLADHRRRAQGKVQQGQGAARAVGFS